MWYASRARPSLYQSCSVAGVLLSPVRTDFFRYVARFTYGPLLLETFLRVVVTAVAVLVEKDRLNRTFY